MTQRQEEHAAWMRRTYGRDKHSRKSQRMPWPEYERHSYSFVDEIRSIMRLIYRQPHRRILWECPI